MKPRRITPAEADALTAHLSPVERRRRMEAFIAHLRGLGVDAEVIFDASGRSFFRINLEQLQLRAPALAALFDQLGDLLPEPRGYTPGVA
jgi:hypothetical protein